MTEPTVAIVIPCLPRDMPYLARAVQSAVRQLGPDNIVAVRVAQETLPKALNRLIGGVTADLIVRLDADDTLANDAVQRLKAGIGDAPIVYAKHYTRVVAGMDHVVEIDMRNPLGCSCMFRHTAWAAIGGFDEELIHQEALDFYLRATERLGPAAFISEPVYYYFRREGSLSSHVEDIETARAYLREKLGGLP